MYHSWKAPHQQRADRKQDKGMRQQRLEDVEELHLIEKTQPQVSYYKRVSIRPSNHPEPLGEHTGASKAVEAGCQDKTQETVFKMSTPHLCTNYYCRSTCIHLSMRKTLWC